MYGKSGHGYVCGTIILYKEWIQQRQYYFDNIQSVFYKINVAVSVLLSMIYTHKYRAVQYSNTSYIQEDNIVAANKKSQMVDPF